MVQAIKLRAEGKGSDPHCPFRNSSFTVNGERNPIKGLLVATEEDREQKLLFGR